MCVWTQAARAWRAALFAPTNKRQQHKNPKPRNNASHTCHTHHQEDVVERVPFLLLGMELPPTPLFKDALEKNIIPQV